MDDKWEAIGNRCLDLALTELEKATVPTAVTVETVGKLVGIAIEIDALKLRWKQQTRYGAAVSRGRP